MSDRPIKQPYHARVEEYFKAQLWLTRKELIAQANHLTPENYSGRLRQGESVGRGRALHVPEAIAQSP
jgi:hypothetical protein